MPLFDHAQELRITKALQEYYDAPIPKPTLAKLARKHMVSYDTLYSRFNGRLAHNRGGQNTRLTKEEDEGLKKYMWFLVRIRAPLGKKDIVAAANSILKVRGEPKVSKD
jgi:hypothetical protein